MTNYYLYVQGKGFGYTIPTNYVDYQKRANPVRSELH
jgi:hypothetical protein